MKKNDFLKNNHSYILPKIKYGISEPPELEFVLSIEHQLLIFWFTRRGCVWWSFTLSDSEINKRLLCNLFEVLFERD